MVEVSKFGAPLGGVVHDVDVRSLDDEQFAAIQAGFAEHLVLAFPGQDLTIEDRVARTQYQLLLSSPDMEQLGRSTAVLVERMQRLPELLQHRRRRVVQWSHVAVQVQQLSGAAHRQHRQQGRPSAGLAHAGGWIKAQRLG